MVNLPLFVVSMLLISFFFSSRRRHTIWNCDWSSDVCSSDLCGFRLLIVTWISSEFTQRAKLEQGCADLGGIIDGIADLPCPRSEERRVGKEYRYRWMLYR